ncbi:MAG TPA: ATP-binding domain-containing protein [Frankiaceae bacterium]|nr:ATP-binding domain-containing protein [Frankiaceae bacterium]
MGTDDPPGQQMTTDVRADLDAERAHMAASRAALHQMRERAEQIGDYAVDALASEALGKARAQRLKALADDGSTPLFFGRIDLATTAETFHIGRRHILDVKGDPMVVDWRAPIALPFYRATAATPMGVERRRRFGFANGVLTSFEDERLTRGEALGTSSRILAEEIERPRVGPMRDIVATIQPDQDEIVRADVEDTICVQGAPGTGKTAVGLHRAAYLLYTYRDRLRRGGVLILGPNRAFLSYIGQVLPALGEVDVTQQTVDDLATALTATATEPPDLATLKGDARMATVLKRALYANVRRPTDALVIDAGGRRRRIDADVLRGLVRDLLHADVRYATARDRLRTHIAEHVRRELEAEGSTPTDVAVQRLAGSAEVRAYVDAHWPPTDPASLLHALFTDADALRKAAKDVLTEAEQAALRWPVTPRSAKSAPWTSADAFLADEVADLLERIPSYGHVILDEAQDLSPMQCRAVGRRCSTGSATLLGDIAQGTTPWATSDWRATLAHLGKPDGRVVALSRGYRVPQQVLDFANRLLPFIAADVAPAASVRRGRGALDVRPQGDAVEAVRAATAREGSIGVVVADAHADDLTARLRAGGIDAKRLVADVADLGARVEVVPATLAKGLEYDHVVVVEPAAIAAAEPRGLRRLYVVLTRAVTSLTVVHDQPLPGPLAA